MSVDEAVEVEAAAAAVAPRRRRWAVIAVALLVLCAGGAGGAWYFGVLGSAPTGEAETQAEEPAAEPVYFTLADNLVVNFRSPNGVRFLQVGIDLMTRDPEAVDALEAHAAVVRNNLILLLSDQTQDELMTREGKEAVREQALREVRSVMQSLYGEPAVESLYFTTFVMQ